MRQRTYGFTIVELLIVIVVIAILASISVIAYVGIQGRANDASVQSDLASIAKKIRAFQAINDRMPRGATDLNNAEVYVTRTAYSQGFDNGSGRYNLVYCWPNSTNPTAFALVAESKSGGVFQYSGGTVSKASYTYTGGSIGICSNAGVDIATSGRDFFYDTGVWQAYAR